MTIQAYPIVPFDEIGEGREHRRKLALVVNNAMRGKLNCGIEIEIEADATLTVIEDDRIHPDCILLFDPLNLAADTALRSGPFFVDEADRGQETATITHADDVGGARFRVVILA